MVRVGTMVFSVDDVETVELIVRGSALTRHTVTRGVTTATF